MFLPTHPGPWFVNVSAFPGCSLLPPSVASPKPRLVVKFLETQLWTKQPERLGRTGGREGSRTHDP